MRACLPLVPAVLVLGLALAGCGQQPATTAPQPHRSPDVRTHTRTPVPTITPAAPTETASLTPHPVTGIATTPPAWLGDRPLAPGAVGSDGYGAPRTTPEELRDREFDLPDTLPELPGDGFAARVEPAPAEVIARSTWSPACPVAADDLDWVRLTFVGFDHERHTGELLVHRAVAAQVVDAFHDLWDQHFPIEEMTILSKADLARRTGDDNDTSAFECHPHETGDSAEAHGLAVDVDPFQNPATEKSDGTTLVKPVLAASYLDRSWDRPGMISPGGPAVRAFRHVGWQWGGTEEPARFTASSAAASGR